MSQSSLPAAVTQLEAAYGAAPASRLFAPLADAYRRTGRVREALDVLQKGTQRHPDYVSAWVLLGLCQRELSGSQAAEITFARVLSLDPENLVALKHRARRALEEADPSTAAAIVERVLEIDPYDREASALRDEVTTLRESQPSEDEVVVSTLPPPMPAPATGSPVTTEESSAVNRDVQEEEPPILDLEEVVPEEEASGPTQALPGAGATAETKWHVQRDADRIVIRPRAEKPAPPRPAQTDEFSTLTLARIYESQGYDDKASAIYEALLQRDPENEELQERLRSVKLRLGSRSDAAAAPREEAATPRRWRLLDAEKLGGEAEHAAEQLRQLADQVRDREEDKRHTVIGRPPSAAPPPPEPPQDAVRSDEPDFERFLRYVRSLKR